MPPEKDPSNAKYNINFSYYDYVIKVSNSSLFIRFLDVSQTGLERSLASTLKPSMELEKPKRFKHRSTSTHSFNISPSKAEFPKANIFET